MRESLARRVPAWALAVFGCALLARLAFLALVDQPLLYTHQYAYFTSALRIAEHPRPLAWILGSDEWRTWDQHWTIAPLYYLFAAGVFRWLGPHLLPLQVLQCLLDAVVAVAVAALGRAVAGRRGAWAGVAYAFYWPAIEMPSWTLTENLHTPLLLAGALALTRAARRPGVSGYLLSGLLLGVSALARAVSSAFIGLAALWRLASLGPRAGWRPALLVGVGGALVILPWTARNVLVVGDHVLIESAAFENIWWANNFVEREEYLRQERVVHSQPTPAAKRRAALGFAIEGIRRRPEAFLDKVRSSFWHLLRPEGLQNLLRIERSLEPWRHAASVLLDDLPLVACIPLLCVFFVAGRPSPERGVLLLWIGYYLLMVVVVFHNEVRYRSALVPFFFAGAAGGLAILADPARRLRWRPLLGLALGLYVAHGMLGPYVPLGADALRAWWALRPMAPAVSAGDWIRAERAALEASARDPGSPRPWLLYGSALAYADETGRAIAAYREGAERASSANWSPRIALPMLLTEAGPSKEGIRRLNTLDKLSWNTDPWLVLEIAWRELPAPRTSEVLLARGDYGAVRGFLYPRGGDPSVSAHRLEWNDYAVLGAKLPPPGGHRWSRGRAWLRLRPSEPAAAYDVTLEMGAPFPSTLREPRVAVGTGARVQHFTLGAEVRAYTWRVPAPAAGEPLLLRLDAPTWCLAGEPAEQGVRVDRLAVQPARGRE